MLQAIRDKVTGWIAYGIIFLISIPFALWGVNSYLGGGEAAPVAVVNGEEIDFNEFEQAYSNYRQRLARMFGGSIPDALGGEQVLREQVRDQMIERYALRQYIDEARYRVGDAELSRLIRGMQEFQRDGQFDNGLYEAQLRSLGYSPLGFEAEMRQSSALEQLQAGIAATAFVTPRTRQQLVDLGQQTRKLRILRYRTDADAIEVDDAEIEAEYEKNKDSYRTAEQVKIDYIDVSLDAIKERISVDEDTLQARYADNLHHYTTPEIREASHILIKVDDQVDREAALEEIRALRTRIESGEDFAALAGEFSDDPVSAADGGNLGEIERGVMVQAFEEALYSLEVGELSEPVETGFGWHLIKLHSVSGGESRSFESVRAELEDEIRTEQAESQVFELVESLANMAYEQSDSLRPAAEQLDLELQTSDWFSRFGGEGLAANDAIRRAAFSDEVKRQGLNSEAIELGPERVVFLRVSEIKPAEQQPLEAVRDAVRQRLVEEKLREKNREVGEEALAELTAGNASLEDLAAQWNAEIDDPGFVGRRQGGVDAAVRNRAFRMPRPGQDPVYEGLLQANGDYVIIELAEIATGDSETGTELQQQLAEALGSADYRAAARLLTSRAEVVRTPLEELY